MKHLKSTSSDLRRLFERAVCIREITEPLVSYDADCDAESIRLLMEARNFDVIGLREDGRLVGYARRKELKSGPVRVDLIRFSEGDVLVDTEPLVTALQALRRRTVLFISVFGQVGGIVTKGDLQKAPVRLWLFGIISLIEMQMLRLIRNRYPNGTWRGLLSQARVDAAKMLFTERQQRNEEANVSDYSDCLQICDKATIFLKDSKLTEVAAFKSRNAGKDFFSFLESLRNDLAHSNDILNGRWPELAERVVESEGLLMRLESETGAVS